jgi:2-dehydropantoate 2-reductase
VKHVGRGDLVLGPQNSQTEQIAEVFLRAGVPCKISDTLQSELWTKLVWNCALNAVSALGKATYGDIIASADAKKVVENVVYEVLAVAKAAGIPLPLFTDPAVALAGAYKIAEQMAATRSSTAQDMMRNKTTEIDSLNGFIVRKAAALGVPVPVNQTLFTLVRLSERSLK